MSSGAAPATIGTGTPEFAAALLTDLYVKLRRDLQRWAAVTHQTPQPRMGYVGQHLVSVVTGFPGGRSGARGDDLKLPDGAVAEIKCCYRVDQLGKCARCGTQVASIEKRCPSEKCGASEITRMDDSKWLLTPKSEQELREMFIPVRFYFVLFEFADVAKADEIDVEIFEIDPKCLGFALCMIDYFFNIRAKSKSNAPFNLWPWSAKFAMMRPKSIYHALIAEDDLITTTRFPGMDAPVLYALPDLTSLATTKTISETAIDHLAEIRGVDVSGALLFSRTGERRVQKLKVLEKARREGEWVDEGLADDMARAVYGNLVLPYGEWTKAFAETL